MNQRTVNLVKHEAKKRRRSGQAKSYTAALAQLAMENGFEKWEDYEKVLLAVPNASPGFRVRLAPAVGNESTVSVFIPDLLRFHAMEAAQWQQSTAEEREQLVHDFALSSKRTRGDFETYTVEITTLGVSDEAPPEASSVLGNAPAGAPVSEPADFYVEIEARGSKVKETVGLHLVDVLDIHGLSPIQWQETDRFEQEELVMEAALWGKRSRGDLASYFTTVVSGFDKPDDAEGADTPR